MFESMLHGAHSTVPTPLCTLFVNAIFECPIRLKEPSHCESGESDWSAGQVIKVTVPQLLEGS